VKIGTIGTGESLSFPLDAGSEKTLMNETPARWDVAVETTGGSIISFTVPPNGEFRIKTGGDVAAVRIGAYDLNPAGPRPVGD
jgi:hypothetical protein